MERVEAGLVATATHPGLVALEQTLELGQLVEPLGSTVVGSEHFRTYGMVQRNQC